jgi:hypothetical protein
MNGLNTLVTKYTIKGKKVHKGGNKDKEVVVMPSGQGKNAFWSHCGKAFVVTCLWGKGKNVLKIS